MPTFPARLHVILARESRAAVVFRRGPSRHMSTFLWDRGTDIITPGQWLNGRIYERRADLSPDGRLMIYFATNHRWQSETGGSWTAVSRTPWLKAVSLYGKNNCWEGGGLFLSNGSYWLNDRCVIPERISESVEITRVTDYSPAQKFGSEDTGVYYPRLLRDGWVLVDRRKDAEWNAETVFDKRIDAQWTLRKIAHEQVNAPPGKGCYWDEHELRRNDSTTRVLPSWEWADVDDGQLVWAERGCVYRAPAGHDGVHDAVRLVHDFNAYTFVAVEAPY